MIRLLLLSLCCPGIFGLGIWSCQNATIGLTRNDEKSCSKFHQCTPLGDLEFQCPMGMVYNERQGVCDCGGQKLCNDRVVLSPCPRMTGPNICKDVKLGSLLPHPHACDVFFQCASVGPLVFKCPAGTVFNPLVNVCDWPQNTNCEDEAIQLRQFFQCFGSYCHPPASWTVCNCPPFPGCPCSCAPASGPAEVQITPKPTEVTTTSAFEMNKSPVKEEETHNRTSHFALRMCPNIDREDPLQPVHLPHKQCDSFYKCFLGVPIPFKCPPGLVWHIGLDRCDYQSDFACEM